MIELLGLLLAALIDAVRSRQRLLLENLLLRQQLQVALRNQRRPRLRTRDKLFWLLVRLSRYMACVTSSRRRAVLVDQVAETVETYDLVVAASRASRVP